MKRISAPTMIEDGRLSGNEPAARLFDETARHQFVRECELEGLITQRMAVYPAIMHAVFETRDRPEP